MLRKKHRNGQKNIGELKWMLCNGSSCSFLQDRCVRA